LARKHRAAGEDYTALAKTFPTPPASAGIVFDGDEGRLSEAAFLRDFAGDLPEAKKVLYADQEPFHKAGKTPRGLKRRHSNPRRSEKSGVGNHGKTHYPKSMVVGILHLAAGVKPPSV
jgi:hypothetical protein